MQLTTLAADLKLGAAAAIIGAIAAGAISFTMPRRYVSTAMMRIAPRSIAKAEAVDRLQEMQGEILSRSSLTEIIQRPTMDLYRQERAIYPMEDVIEKMRNRDVHIERGTRAAFRMSFEYPDRVKAQAVVRELTARSSGYAEILTPASLPEKPSQPDRLAIMGIGLGVGLGLGILLAFLRRRGVKWTLRMAGCTVAGCVSAAAICLLMPDTFADGQKSYQFAALGAFTGLALGAFLLRARGTGRNHYARLIAFSAACGAIAGGLVSFALPERYVSTAVIRASPFSGGGAGAAQLEIEPAERLRQLTDEILSRGSMAELIQRPSLDLYRKERQRYPLEDIIEDMRHRDIRIASASPASLNGLGLVTSLQISFEYPDSYKAQAVVRELVTKFTEGNVRAYRDLPRGQMAGSLAFNVAAERKPDRDKVPGSLVLEVVDPATLPASPVSPNRPAAAAIGLLAGMLLGSLLAARRWLAARQAATPGPHPSYWKYALVAAALGAIAFGLLSFAIPNRYVSTAVLRLVSADPRAAVNAQAAAERMQEMFHQVLSRDSLSEIIVHAPQLYAPERARGSLDEVVKQMRDRDLRVEPLRDSPFGGRPTAFRISFEYSDPKKARACVQALVSRFVEGALQPKQDALPAATAGPGCLQLSNLNLFTNKLIEGGGDGQRKPATAYLEVLDAASMPERPVSPNRMNIGAAGGLAGLLLGIVIARARRPAPLPAAA
jgi:capsular polysaccharide biosynthesis protein